MPLFKEQLYRMSAYSPPLAGRSAKSQLLLDFNERTLPLGKAVIDALETYIHAGGMQKYPSYEGILDQLAGYMDVREDRIMITNGSDQGIDLVARASLNRGDTAIIPEPTFAMYRQAAEVEAARVVAPWYDMETGYPLHQVMDALSDETKLIVVSSPNNPTGTGVSSKDIEKLLKAAPNAVVLVDECYYEYSQQTVLGLINEYNNLVVARTFSKTWGMPSLRFGCLISQTDNIEQLLKIRGPYDVNQLAVVAVEAALANPEYTEDYVTEVMTVSKPMLENWLKARNIDFWPSEANFLWVFSPRAKELEEFLRKRHILVRPKRNNDGELGLRITLGVKSQTEQLIYVMEQFYG